MTKKNSQMLLLFLLFAVCGTVGYFLGELIIRDDSQEDTAPIVEAVPEPVIQVSRIPYAALDKEPVRGNDGTYTFTVAALVDSEEPLEYILYSDEECTMAVMSSVDGIFTGVQPINSRTYYVRVQNLISKDFSEVITVQGFVIVPKYKKITKEELHKLFNVDRSWTAAPAHFPTSLAPNYGRHITVLGMEPDERKPGSLGDICAKMDNVWSSVSIEDLAYDDQNRLVKLVIKVTY